MGAIPTLVVAGTHSGAGKTSVALGLMGALRQRGLQVQPFKVGPDFIDPGHHQRATGRISYNLDGWMLSRAQNLDIFARASQGADLAIVEGVMGLFDGYGSQSEAGSTAELAKWLGAPVILVIDARAMGRSAAALVRGFARFDPNLNLAGIICNRVGSPSHLQRLREAIESVTGVPVLGSLPRSPTIEIGERHLGLRLAGEAGLSDRYLENLATLTAQHLDCDRLLACSRQHPAPIVPVAPLPHPKPIVRIGVARDEAFCFYYQPNLDLLRAAGAELVEFSPLRDRFPANLDGLYIGGGYPELHLESLSADQEMRSAIATFCHNNKPVYAECGGLMYLSQGIELNSESGRRQVPFVGVFPFWVRMGDRAKLGYTEVQVTASSPIPSQNPVRGHRFHYSEIVGEPSITNSYVLQSWRDRGRQEGYTFGDTIASYVHLHFGSNPSFATNFVRQCAQQRSQG